MEQTMLEICANLTEEVHTISPLVHHITNYVTVNDCANITLGIGASPIMADSAEEAADITKISSALVLNMGTLNERTVPSMIQAGKAANAANIPVVFDPVGAGASNFRNETAKKIVDEVKLTVLRGNISEIRFLSGLSSETKGVDASQSDLHESETAKDIAASLAKKLDCVVAITGAIDVVSDGKQTFCIENGHAKLSSLTGTGCMSSSLTGSFCGAAPKKPLASAIAALLCMGIAGEIAFEKAGQIGNGSFRCALHDAISQMSPEILRKRAKLYESSF